MTLVAETSMAFLPFAALEPDPDNPRRYYPEADVAALASSIALAGGVELPLLVCPDGNGRAGLYRILDGHMRWQAARSLGADAPLLKCEIRSKLSRRERLLLMARTSSLWFAKDPISEAVHYRKLIDEEAVSRTQLAREVGLSIATVDGRLALLDLDPEIQELVAQRLLPKDRTIVTAFLSIPDPADRVALARELARRGATLRTTVRACERAAAKFHSSRRREGPAAAAPSLASASQIGDAPSAVAWRGLRSAAASACGSCEVKAQSLSEVPEPAWSLVSHAAEMTCDGCGLATTRGMCSGCPLPEMLARVIRDAQSLAEVGHVRAR